MESAAPTLWLPVPRNSLRDATQYPNQNLLRNIVQWLQIANPVQTIIRHGRCRKYIEYLKTHVIMIKWFHNITGKSLNKSTKYLSETIFKILAFVADQT